MDLLTDPTAVAVATAPRPVPTAPDDALLAEALVEDVSIDGMCGVY